MKLQIMSDLHFEMHADGGAELIRELDPTGVVFSYWRATSRWPSSVRCQKRCSGRGSEGRRLRQRLPMLLQRRRG